MVFGGAVLLVGALFWLDVLNLSSGRGLFGWFGRLPGDIRYEGENTRVFIPITSMLLISVALTLVLNLVRRL